MDVVPDALRAMRAQFGGGVEDWTSSSEDANGDDAGSNHQVVWRHVSGRATLIEGDILTKRPELSRYFDAVYDKDSFGALQLDMRPKFCEDCPNSPRMARRFTSRLRLWNRGGIPGRRFTWRRTT